MVFIWILTYRDIYKKIYKFIFIKLCLCFPDYDSEDMSIDNGSNQNRYYDSSDTSDDDLWLGDLSAASSDSSLAEYGMWSGVFVS